ncbi:probable indole-3-pyruvate monooxygenase YUCCA10 [Impatiens glandulifera]|uniref:probable indole-3-pyruvate monooxygenase YUCCA10 n=1 Tax=Impatiens glandulifera TaxID=253017 RepID=UPI001FB12331|nr:probable indole-3-pyruvate monooxygenase YUCCA10 [Impatiens glandulifera]
MEGDKQRCYKVIIVGAGPSGLAMAASLNILSIPNVILERDNCFAPLWQNKTYDRLKLHVAKSFCELPHMPYPKSYPTYVSRKELVQYLDHYINHFKITPRYNRFVESADYVEFESTKKWNIKARNINSEEMEEYSCDFLIVATGENGDAFIPNVEGLETFVGEVIHTTQYKSGERYAGKNVLVVGSGNSGMQIALDLANHGAKTSIVVKSDMHILWSEATNVGLYLLKYISVYWVDSLLVMLSKLKYGNDLSKYGFKRPKEGPFLMKDKYGKYPIIDIGTMDKIKSGQIQVLPLIMEIKGSEVSFNNGKSYSFDVIIFATGFKRSTNKWLKGDDYLLNEDGLSKPSFPNHWKGQNGLYCVGLCRRGFFGASLDAINVANDIKALLTAQNQNSK